MAEKNKEAASYADMDSDQLLKTVKDRDKKLKKVESKFVEVHEARRLLKQDRDTFLNFLTLVFPEPTLQEVLLPEDQIGLYDIDHLRQFWQLQQSKQTSQQVYESDNLQKEIQKLNEQVSDQGNLQQKIESLEQSCQLLRQSETDFQKENERMKVELQTKGADAGQNKALKQERDALKEQVQELQKDNSANQAKLLMSALGNNSSSGDNGLSSLMGGMSSMGSMASSAAASDQTPEQVERATQLEREVSALTNENLKLKDGIQDLQNELEGQIKLNQPETQETNQRLIEEEIGAKVALQMEEQSEEVLHVKAQNSELLSKLQAITNEFAVMKSDAEIVKQKARQLLIEKDEELERMRANKAGTPSGGQLGGQSMSPSKEFAQHDSRQRVGSGEPDSGASTFNEGAHLPRIIEADNTSMMMDSSPTKTSGGGPLVMLPKGLDTDYVRNILLKYLEYMASGENEKEALTLEKVLFTVLNASPQDLASLEKTRKRNNTGIWSYFYDLPNSKIAKPVQPSKLRQGASFGSDVSPGGQKSKNSIGAFHFN